MIDRQGAIAILRNTLIHTATKPQIRDGSKWYAPELSKTRYLTR